MNPRAEEIRRKLALYRGYLASGAGPDLATIYLRQITQLEAQLRQIESESDKRD